VTRPAPAAPDAPALSDEERPFARFPGARAPDRRRDVDAHGVRLRVVEWGAADGRPLLLAHGGFDFAQTWSGFAPLLADAGWRVVGWDQRGHGDSAHAALYSWDADMRDALSVLDSVTHEPLPFVGHSKGGSVLTSLAHAVSAVLIRGEREGSPREVYQNATVSRSRCGSRVSTGSSARPRCARYAS